MPSRIPALGLSGVPLPTNWRMKSMTGSAVTEATAEAFGATAGATEARLSHDVTRGLTDAAGAARFCGERGFAGAGGSY